MDASRRPDQTPSEPPPFTFPDLPVFKFPPPPNLNLRDAAPDILRRFFVFQINGILGEQLVTTFPADPKFRWCVLYLLGAYFLWLRFSTAPGRLYTAGLGWVLLFHFNLYACLLFLFHLPANHLAGILAGRGLPASFGLLPLTSLLHGYGCAAVTEILMGHLQQKRQGDGGV